LGCFQSPKLIRGIDAFSISPFLVIGDNTNKVYTPVARLEAARLLLALVAQQGWEVHHMDVKSVFMNSVLLEEVYVMQPPGFVVTGGEDKVLKPKRLCMGFTKHLEPGIIN
jgi:hypothetical protein